jgi:hypothetical protein
VDRDVRCPSCPVESQPTGDTYQVLGQRKGKTIYLCSTCGTKFESPGLAAARYSPEAYEAGETVWTPEVGLEGISRMLQIDSNDTTQAPIDSQKATEPPATPPTKAHESVTRVSEEPVKHAQRRARAKNVNPEPVTAAATERSDPDPIDLHSDVGWVYPSTPGKYHFHWEPPDLGQKPLSKWRQNWNETRNMLKYFRWANDPIIPRPPRETGPSKAQRGLDELRELKPTEPDAI